MPLPPPPAASAASQRTGRAHIPEGFALPDEPQFLRTPAYESTLAGIAGYWLPQLLRASTDQHAAWNATQVPLRYAAHERFDHAREGLNDDDGRVVFHYLGELVSAPPAKTLVHPAAARGIARAVTLPAPMRAQRGDETARVSGIWVPRLPTSDSRAAHFNHWLRQRYVLKGQNFPALLDAPEVEAGELIWHCCGQANEERSERWSRIRVDDGPASRSSNA